LKSAKLTLEINEEKQPQIIEGSAVDSS